MGPRTRQHSPLDDKARQALQDRFHRGDVDAFSALVEPHLNTLYTLCLRISSNPTEAEDLAQEALLRALNKHRSYNPTRRFRPWLLTIATNLCRDRLRTVWWRRVLPFSKPQHSQALGPEHAAQRSEQDAQVRAALHRLPTQYREALSLFHLDDMSYQEMAVITGTSIPALKQRVRRGRVMLRDVMKVLYPDMSAET